MAMTSQFAARSLSARFSLVFAVVLCLAAPVRAEKNSDLLTNLSDTAVGGYTSASAHFSEAPAALHIRSLLPLTLSGTWEAHACRRGDESAEGTFELNINTRRRVSGWFTNAADESVLRVRGQISRRGLVTARVQERLTLRGVVTGTTNPAIQGIILRRCVGVFESFRPAPQTNSPPDTNCCVNPTNPPAALFPDTNLAAYVSEQLQKPVDQITPGDLSALTRIDLYYGNVRDLSGLQHATNLSIANVQASPITNYSALYRLPYLQYLYLSHLTNPVFVTNFTQLWHLSIRYSAFDDASLILAMPNLRSLDLEGTYFPALAALASSPDLTVLEHYYAGVTNVVPHSALTQLRILGLYGNPIDDLAPLATLTNLTSIYLGGYALTNFDAGLSSMKDLYFALITEAGLTDLEWLTSTNMGILYLRNNSLTNISRLALLQNLWTLDLSGNPVSDFTPLAQLPLLSSLALNEVGLTSLSFAAALENLYTLRASVNSITDLSPLAACPGLRNVELNQNQISDLTPLTACTNLTYLSLSSNHVADLSALAGAQALTYLDVSLNDINDLSPLTNLTALTSLQLNENQITNIEPVAAATSLSFLDLASNGISDISPLLGLTNLYYVSLYLNPLDLSAGSTASNVVHTLRSRGASVTVGP